MSRKAEPPEDTPRGARPTLAGIGLRLLSGSGRYLGVLTMLAALIVYLAITQPAFRTYDNLIVIFETNSVLLIASLGLTFVLLAGGFDLSIGAMLALAGVLLGKMVAGSIPQPIALVITILGGCLIGWFVNGFLIARLRLNFFVVTIGTMSAIQGIALVVTGGLSADLYSAHFLRFIGDGRLLGIPMPVLISLALLAICSFVGRQTGFGRMVYAVGGNEEASRLAGINVVGVRMATYAISAALAALAGIVSAGRLASAAPDAGSSIPLTAAAAVLLGGTSFTGGIGGMFGTFLGVLFLGVLSNGLIIAGISSFWDGVVTGGVLIAAVLIDRLQRTHGF